MSAARSSSAVRDLKAIFENRAATTLGSETPGSRGRSPSGLGSDKENGYRTTSKIRASFVPVEPASMATTVEDTSMNARRGSFGEGDGDLLDLKKTVSEQQQSMEVPESVLQSAVVTPLKTDGEGRLGHDESPLEGKVERAPENPDKAVTGAEEELGSIKPADLADEDAVSGGEALPPVTEDLRPAAKPAASASKAESKKATTNGKPAAISTKAKPSTSSIKSPSSQPKTPLSGKTPIASPQVSTSKAPLRKPSRSSLTAPTAASMARSGAADKGASKTSPTTRLKPREVTKPVNLPSHLTAPTASSKAKQEPEPSSASTALRTSTATRPKPQPSTRPAPRASLAAQQRPVSQGSQTSGRRSLAPADGSFLDRMTRPTAASSGKTTQKVEAKSPARTKPVPSKAKVNGTAAKSGAQPVPQPAELASGNEVNQEPMPDEPNFDEDHGVSEEPSGLAFADEVNTLEEAYPTAKGEISTGNETPIPHSQAEGGAEGDGALEATPAALGGESIR